MTRLSSGPNVYYYQGNKFKDQTFCCNVSLEPPAAYYCSIPALRGKRIISRSYDGWLVLYDDRTELFYLCDSTTTFDAIALPFIGISRHKVESCVLSCSPAQPDCKVLLFLKDLHSILCCWMRDVEPEWINLRYGYQLKAIGGFGLVAPPTLCRPVVCSGKIYATLSSPYPYPNLRLGDFWSIEIVERKGSRLGLGVVLSRLEAVPKWKHPNGPSALSGEYMVGSSCGDLFLIRIIWGGIKLREPRAVGINKMNLYTMAWKPVKSVVKDRSFFICSEYSLAWPVEAGSGGCVYFNFNGDLRGERCSCCDDGGAYEALCCYDTRDDSVSVSVPLRSSPTEQNSIMSIKPAELPIRPEVEDRCDDDKLSRLPLDVMGEVTKRLAPFDYVNFRAASRICRYVAPHISWGTALDESFKKQTHYNFSTSSSCPLLMFSDKDQSMDKFVDPRVAAATNYNYLMRNYSCLEGATICYSSEGWVLMHKNRNVYIYNPFTGEIFIYSYPREVSGNSNLVFILNPLASEAATPGGYYDPFFILRISFDEKDSILSVLIGNWSGSLLINYGLIGNWKSEETHHGPVSFQHAFYYMDHNGILLDINMACVVPCSWQHSVEPVAVTPPPCDSVHENYLVECDGKLLGVLVGRGGKWVRVYEFKRHLDGSGQMVKRAVTSLGNHTLYLSRSSSFSTEDASFTRLKSRIYFPRLRGSSGVVFYSMETRKWHCSGSDHDSWSDFYGTRLMMNSCWIQPSWRQISN